MKINLRQTTYDKILLNTLKLTNTFYNIRFHVQKKYLTLNMIKKQLLFLMPTNITGRLAKEIHSIKKKLIKNITHKHNPHSLFFIIQHTRKFGKLNVIFKCKIFQYFTFLLVRVEPNFFISLNKNIIHHQINQIK